MNALHALKNNEMVSQCIFSLVACPHTTSMFAVVELECSVSSTDSIGYYHLYVLIFSYFGIDGLLRLLTRTGGDSCFFLIHWSCDILASGPVGDIRETLCVSRNAEEHKKD